MLRPRTIACKPHLSKEQTFNGHPRRSSNAAQENILSRDANVNPGTTSISGAGDFEPQYSRPAELGGLASGGGGEC